MPNRFHPLAALPLLGCGDSLISGPALEFMLDIGRVPERPGWVQLWVDEGGEGILVSCEVIPIPAQLMGDDQGTVVIDRLEVPPPEWTEPVAWTEQGDLRWALALHLLVDRDRLSFEATAAALEDGEVDQAAGVWGMADTIARLHLDGEIDHAGEALIAGEVPPELDEDGRSWVGFANEIVAATGTFEGALAAIDVEEQIDLIDEGLPVRRLDTLDNASLLLLSGDPFGGLELAWDCDEEADFEEEEEAPEEEELR